MRKILSAALLAVALPVISAPALAADKPAIAPPPAAAWNWQGLYVGATVGAGWGTSDWMTVDNSIDTGSFKLGPGGNIGLTLGYNLISGPVILGIEGDYTLTNLSGNTAIFCSVQVTCQTDNNWLATLRGRLGWNLGQWMPYITGGLAAGDVHAHYSTPITGTASSIETGYAVGGGVEYALGKHVSVKAEYIFADLGSARCPFAVCLNNAIGSPDTNVKLRAQVARIGVNLRLP